MEEVYQGQDYGADWTIRIRDLEEKQRLLNERLMLAGKSLVEQRDKTFSDIQDMKKVILKLKEDSVQIKTMLQNIIEQVNNTVRKDELLIVQRQLDLLRGEK